MNAEIYSKDRYDIFTKINIHPYDIDVPEDHYNIGIAIKQQGVYLSKAVLYINPGISYGKEIVGLIGAYQSRDNIEAVMMLFEILEEQAKKRGLSFLIGPMNGSTWENYRFHDQPNKTLFFLEMKHEAYYPQQWTSQGFSPISHYYSAVASIGPRRDEKIKRAKNRLLKDGVTIRPVDKDRYESELKRLHPLLQEAFKQNFLYTPISESSFMSKYLPLLPILKPEQVLIAEHEDKAVGVLLGLDDLSDRSNKTLILKTLARSPKRLFAGLGLVLTDEFYRYGVVEGYEQIIFAFMIDDGDATPLSDQFSGHPLKSYTLYGKAL